MTLCQCTCSSQSNTNSCHSLPWAFTVSGPPVKKANLHEPFQTATFQNDASNSLVQSIDFLEFLVDTLSVTNHNR